MRILIPFSPVVLFQDREEALLTSPCIIDPETNKMRDGIQIEALSTYDEGFQKVVSQDW